MPIEYWGILRQKEKIMDQGEGGSKNDISIVVMKTGSRWQRVRSICGWVTKPLQTKPGTMCASKTAMYIGYTDGYIESV